MRLEAKNAVALVGGRTMPLQAFAGTAVHAIAAIGNPQRFFDMLRSRGIDVVRPSAAGSRPHRAEDIFFADDLPVLMTEKDAVKCKDMADPRHWYVPVSAYFAATKQLHCSAS